MEDIKYELPALPAVEYKMPETVLIELPVLITKSEVSTIDTPAAPSPKKSRLGAKLAAAYAK